jgi:hypothetical protein
MLTPSIKHALSLLVDALPDVANMVFAVLGVMMSFPDKATRIERNSTLRKGIATTCFVLAFVGLFVAADKRLKVDTQMTVLVGNVNNLVTNTNNLVANTSTVVTMVGIMLPQVEALNTHIGELDVKIAAAKGNPKLLQELQNQATAARARAESLSTTLLLSVVPGVVNELQARWNACNDADQRSENMFRMSRNVDTPRLEQERLDQEYRKNQFARNASCTNSALPLVRSANYLREELLRKLPPSARQSEEDKKADALFSGLLSGAEPASYMPLATAADYLDRVSKRFPAAPTGLSATTP